MSSSSLQAIVLAAGKSSRFRTQATKLSFPLCGQTMILYPVKLLQSLAIPTTIVVGPQKEIIYNIIHQASLPTVSFIEQQEMRGTGHALWSTKTQWTADHILVMNGDMPLVHEQTLKTLIEKHILHNASITFVTAYNADPLLEGYGRIIHHNSTITGIVEAREFNGDTTKHCFINAGIYLFKRSFLEKAIESLSANTTTGEIYITDLIQHANQQQAIIQTVDASFDTIRGINTLKDLSAAESIKRSELIQTWMEQGVHFLAPHHTYIDNDVTLGSGTIIGAGVHILQGSNIGRHCYIDAFSIITKSTLDDRVTILPHCVLHTVTIAQQATVGPFAHLRNQAALQENVVIGNFVEVTKTTVGCGSKIKHLSYIGNANIGSHVNIGAGTITCNYDGYAKHTTTIEDNAHIGANNALVAPVTIGKDALTAAGSVITDNVPQDALAIARARQINKDGYTQRLRKKYTSAAKISATQTHSL